MKDQLVKEKKKIIAVHPNYRRSPYQYTIPISNTSKKFITGQEDVLTEDKMRGKDKLTVQDKKKLQMGDSPFIINPDIIHPLLHGRVYDLSYTTDGADKEYVNPRDYAEFTCFTKAEIVAKDKESVVKDKHYFYVEDKEKDAQVKINKMDLAWEAESFARSDMGTGRWKDLILLLNLEIPGYNYDPDNLSDTRIKEIVLEACKENPDIVLKLKREDSAFTIFALKLIKYKIISKKDGPDYYYNDTYIGVSIDAIKAYVQNTDHESLVTKWGRIIESKEGRG